jgi:hypothetical protein
MDASDTLDFKNNVSDCYSHTVILNPLILSDSSFARGNLFWSVVNLCDTVEIKNLKSFVYNAPFFITQNHNEVGLSHLFYVKLNSLNDTLLLKQLSASYQIDILGNNLYQPLWFTLACSNKSYGNALEMANIFYETGLFSSAEPDIMIDGLLQCVNDSLFVEQWGLYNNGQLEGVSGVDIKYCEAREITSGDENIIVAVLDDGVDLQHPDLPNVNRSYDLLNNPYGTVYGSHGTACAGIIGASANNNIGVAGVAPECSIMSIANNFNLNVDVVQRIANGISYAWRHGASVISNSWVGNDLPTSQINAAIHDAVSLGRNGKGTVVVFASGNNNRSSVEYPSSNEEVIAVGGVDRCGYRCIRIDVPNLPYCELWDNVHKGSSYGDRLSVVAPGVHVATTDRHGPPGYSFSDYMEYFLGTSSACPFVSGVAALMLSVDSTLTANEVKNIIEQTAQKVGGYYYAIDTIHLNGKWNNEVGYGLVNAHQAVTTAKLYHIDYSITGPAYMNMCEEYTYTLTGTVPANFDVKWETSPYLIIVDGQGTSTVKVRALYPSVQNSITANVCFMGAVGKTVIKDSIVSTGQGYVPLTNIDTTFNQSGSTIAGEFSFGNILTIDSGAVLTITNTIHFTDSARLIVRPGGKLVIDGGTLTSACPNEMWQGIEVVGDRTKRQLAQYQGTVELRNGATIENAHCGIRTGLREDTINFATTGGIITAEDAHFVNNRRAVEFLSYTNHNVGGYVTNNQSSFTNCSFVVDDDNLFSQSNGYFIDHVTMWEVRGVQFKGCAFENATTGQNDRRHAIYTEDAGFIVDKICTSPAIDPTTCTCSESASIHSTFSGFTTAIEANTTGEQHPVRVDFAVFVNNCTGVRINGNPFVTVTRCTFNLQSTPQVLNPNTGLVLNHCSGYLVEGNTFTRKTSVLIPKPTGISVINSGPRTNSVYRNTFNKMHYGIHVSDTNGGLLSGLSFSCNEFNNCEFGIYATANASLAPSQGSLSQGVDNRFSGTQISSFYNLGPTQLVYYHSNGNNNLYLTNPTGVFAESDLATGNNCTSTLCGVIPDPGPMTSFAAQVSAYTSALAYYNDNTDNLDNNNSPNPPNSPTTLAEMHQTLSDTYYGAVRSLMSDSLLDLSALEQWHAAAQPIADPYSLTETRFMEGYTETFAGNADSAEMANYAEFHAMKVALRAQNDNAGEGNDNMDNMDNNNSPMINWYALTPAQIAQLQTIAERNTGRASVMAKGVLCFFFGICYEDEEDTDPSAETQAKRAATGNEGVSDTPLRVWPNPTDDLLFVELCGAEIASVALYDLQGRAVETRHGTSLQGGTATVNMRNVPAGVYVLRVTDAEGREHQSKVVRR